MLEMERGITVARPVAEAFDYVSSVSNLPVIVALIQDASLKDGGSLLLRGVRGGHEFRERGYFRVHPDGHRIEFGLADGRVRGWLEIRPGDTTGLLSDVTAHITLKGGSRAEQMRESAPSEREEEVHGLLWDALRTIKLQLERGTPEPQRRRGGGRAA